MNLNRFRALVLSLALLGGTAAAASTQEGCTKQQATAIENGGLKVMDYGCVLANAFLADETVADVCKIEAALVPALKELLKEHRGAVTKYAAAHVCK